MKYIMIIFVMLVIGGCGPKTPPPTDDRTSPSSEHDTSASNEQDASTSNDNDTIPSREDHPLPIPAQTIMLEDNLINGPIWGCGDAVQLVSQSIIIPSGGNIMFSRSLEDRVMATLTGVKYKYSIRAVNPFNCEPYGTGAEMPDVTVGLEYIGDYSKNLRPMCINASKIKLTHFEVTNTVVDSLIESLIHETIWLEMDRVVIDRLDSILGDGSFSSTDNPRCSFWEEAIENP